MNRQPARRRRGRRRSAWTCGASAPPGCWRRRRSWSSIIQEVEGTPRKLHRVIYDTHDEFIKKALSSICAHLYKLRAQQVDRLSAKLSLKSEELQKSGATTRQQIQKLLEEAADHCRAHPVAFRSLYALHDSIRQRQETEARHAARLDSLEKVRHFMENDPNLKDLLHNNEQK